MRGGRDGFRDRARNRGQKIEPAIIAGRVPPHDLDAEAAVLSAILLAREALAELGKSRERFAELIFGAHPVSSGHRAGRPRG